MGDEDRKPCPPQPVDWFGIAAVITANRDVGQCLRRISPAEAGLITRRSWQRVSGRRSSSPTSHLRDLPGGLGRSRRSRHFFAFGRNAECLPDMCLVSGALPGPVPGRSHVGTRRTLLVR
jgi:hypothetical protein